MQSLERRFRALRENLPSSSVVAQVIPQNSDDLLDLFEEPEPKVKPIGMQIDDDPDYSGSEEEKEKNKKRKTSHPKNSIASKRATAIVEKVSELREMGKTDQ